MIHNIDLGYTPRPGQATVHRVIGSKRFSVIIAHRRFGKSVLARMELIHRALSTPRFEGAYIAPFLSQGRRVFWGPLKDTCLKIHGTECKETEMLVIFPNGSTIRCLGADNADGIRGLGFDFVVGDEYADWGQEVLPMVVMPTLAGREGGICLIGTPKGQDPLVTMYETQKDNPLWACFKFSALETGVLSAEELAIMRSAMSDQQYRLELLVDYDAGSPGQLISGQLVEESMLREYNEEVYRDQARIMGADIARQGDDRSCICRRQGLQCWDIDAWQSSDLMVTSRKIREAYDLYKPDALFIDGGGIGAGVVDALRDMDVPVIEVQFGSKATDSRFLNLRAEMWMAAYHWIRRGGRLPSDNELKQELTSPLHFTNDKGQTQLESKLDLRKRGMRSPDKADAFAMTFAMPVHPQKDRDAAPSKSIDTWQLW